jgi:hypothetical protein
MEKIFPQDKKESWEIGEAYAQSYSESNLPAIIPWGITRDIKKPGSSLPGADIVGFYKHESGTDNQDIILKGIQEEISDTWDQKLLKSIFRCWLKLSVKKDWDDLSQIGKEIINLRQSQQIYEEKYLTESKDSQQSAFLLIALYHLSKSTELLATYMMQGKPATIHGQLDKHYENSIEAVVCANDTEFETILRWLYCASNYMVDGSV